MQPDEVMMETVVWTLPELGENVDKATVLRVLVRVGEAVQQDQPVIEVETDKVTVEVPCTVAGKITAVHLKTGDQVSTGERVISVEVAETPKPGRTVDSKPRPSSHDSVAASGAGRGAASAGDVSQMVGGMDAEPRGHATGAAAPHTRGGNVPVHGQGVRAAPMARRLARELGMALDAIPGSGPHGEVFLDDVKEYAHDLISHAPGARRTPLPDFAKWGPTRREPMSRIRRTTAERMTTAWTTIPHVTHFDDADITAVEQQRKAWNATASNSAPKLTMTAILLQITARALQQFPDFNASLDLDQQEIVYKEYIHVGVAVDTEQGLLVPVIKQAETKGLVALAEELANLATKARARTLTLDDVQGATFTITNLGGIGGTNFTPIINPPEVAILAVSRGRMVGKKLRLPLGLSYDHRLIDGANAARFLRAIVEGLEGLRL